MTINVFAQRNKTSLDGIQSWQQLLVQWPVSGTLVDSDCFSISIMQYTYMCTSRTESISDQGQQTNQLCI